MVVSTRMTACYIRRLLPRELAAELGRSARNSHVTDRRRNQAPEGETGVIGVTGCNRSPACGIWAWGDREI
jgi:hypothetical protein